AGWAAAGRAAAGEMRVTSVTVLPAGEEPSLAGALPDGEEEPVGAPAADWLPGIRDEHDDEGGWAAAWLDRPTWDRSITPNIRRRRGARPLRGGRRRG
ncbi:MAG TPA: hypothetical protein VNJ28_03730, partial [Candidatus Limnocylindrales bacterium]|nr:hypothetical protein [Candidatus Limnocylindrales bacterium]